MLESLVMLEVVRERRPRQSSGWVRLEVSEFMVNHMLLGRKGKREVVAMRNCLSRDPRDIRLKCIKGSAVLRLGLLRLPLHVEHRSKPEQVKRNP
jgi:hypothetical protein